MRDLDKKREYARDWYYRNRTLCIQRTKEWGEAHVERRRAAQKKYRDKNKEAMRNRQIGYRYGLTPAQWQALFESQGKCCANQGCKAIESGTKKGWHIDHDHKTGKVRGILCHGCNVALGKIDDSVDRLKGLIDYVRAHVQSH